MLLVKARKIQGTWYILYIAIFPEKALFLGGMRLVAYGPEFQRQTGRLGENPYACTHKGISPRIYILNRLALGARV